VPNRSLLALVLLVASGCGSSAVLEAADAGDMKVFRARLTERLKEGEVEPDEARDIAGRLLGRQIEKAQGPVGKEELDSLEECAPLVETSLERRAAHDDELGARAALIRVQAGLTEPLAYAPYLTRGEAHWRAAAVRSLTLPEPRAVDADGADAARLTRAGKWRRQLMVDPFRDVRLAALQAAVDAADPKDGAAVLEAARLDPHLPVKLTAIEAAGAIGTRETVLGLADLWPGAGEKERVAMVGAWARAARAAKVEGCADLARTYPNCLAWRQLVRASESDDGMAGLVASLELIHDSSPRATRPAVQNAAAVVERHIDEAPTRIRVEAITSAPLSWAHLVEAIVAAAESEDEAVAVAALGRMTELGGKERNDALKRLRALAKGDLPPAAAARQALVAARDGTVAPLLDQDARAKSPAQRADSAIGFAELGKVDKALALLGDQDARVRVRAACAILVMED